VTLVQQRMKEFRAFVTFFKERTLQLLAEEHFFS
jgi:hypothetical protein